MYDAPDSQCWLKSYADTQKPSTVAGRTACAPTRPGPGGDGRTTLEIPATVPGDLLSDLQRAGAVGDPLRELNWLNASLWNANVWTYRTTFVVDGALAGALAAGAGGEALLVFDGVKMGATVLVNGAAVGTIADQFQRHVFPVGKLLNVGAGASNTLSVVFDPMADVGGRYMACTGGWDWAPYTNTFQPGGSSGGGGTDHTMSKGIVKSVYLVGVAKGHAAITHVVPHTFYQGAYPVAPLADGAHAGFDVEVRVHLWAGAGGANGTLTAGGAWGCSSVTAGVRVPPGDSNVTLSLAASADQIKLWWPNGAGAQPLYDVSAAFKARAGNTGNGAGNGTAAADATATATATLTATRRIGFRFFALVTGNDTDPAYVKAATGADGTAQGAEMTGMFWRVNGAVIYVRGANMIPMEELEGRLSSEAHSTLVASAADAGFNTLRARHVSLRSTFRAAQLSTTGLTLL